MAIAATAGNLVYGKLDLALGAILATSLSGGSWYGAKLAHAVPRAVLLRKGMGGGRGVGHVNVLTAEMKDILIRAYEERGGFKRFLKWIDSSDEREDMFYGKMLIKLLPMTLNVQSKQDIVYRSYSEISVALANHGISLDSIQKLKEIEFKPPERNDEQKDKDLIDGTRSAGDAPGADGNGHADGGRTDK